MRRVACSRLADEKIYFFRDIIILNAPRNVCLFCDRVSFGSIFSGDGNMRSGNWQILLLLAAIALLVVAYNRGCFHRVFHTQTQREAFADILRKTNDSLAAQWLRAGEEALQTPVAAPTPYFETGTFSGNAVTVLQFSSIPGRKLKIEIANAGSVKIFADLFEQDSAGLKVLSEADTTKNLLEAESVFGGKYLVRLQPKPGYTGSYQLTLSTAPLIAWPVKAGVPANIGSYWGADRDGGRRAHQGVDIFAKKGSFLVAAADGRAYRVGENNLGGKVIFLRPDHLPVSLYYAHLDSQLVGAGARVNAGDIIGTVGNSGNARNTPPHLHFGIYTNRGAIDPIGFLQKANTPDKNNRNLPAVRKKTVVKRTKLFAIPDNKTPSQFIPPGDTIFVNGATPNFYRVQTTGGKQGYIARGDF